jgi:hypothetical protein
MGVMRPPGVTGEARPARHMAKSSRPAWRPTSGPPPPAASRNLAAVVDVPSLLAERDENEVRKDFTPSERVQMAESIKAQHGNAHGGDRKGEDQDRKCDLDRVAQMAGFGSADTMRRAEEVVGSGDPELVEAMDEGAISNSAAADAAKLPKTLQKEVARAVKKGAKPKKAIAEAKARNPKEKQEEVRDKLGRVVPPRLRDVFADGAVRELAERPEG